MENYLSTSLFWLDCHSTGLDSIFISFLFFAIALLSFPPFLLKRPRQISVSASNWRRNQSRLEMAAVQKIQSNPINGARIPMGSQVSTRFFGALFIDWFLFFNLKLPLIEWRRFSLLSIRVCFNRPLVYRQHLGLPSFT